MSVSVESSNGRTRTHTHKSIELWKALTAIAVVGSTLASAGWIAGLAYLSDEIAQYKESEKWKAPDAIRKLSVLSEKLAIQLDGITDYDTLKTKKQELEEQVTILELSRKKVNADHERIVNKFRAENEELINGFKQEITTLQNRITDTNIEIEQLNAVIEGLRGEIIEVKIGQAEPVGHKSIRVGVTLTSAISNYASVTSGDFSSSNMMVGDNFSRNVEGKKYVITLVKISDSLAGFSFDEFVIK